MPDLSQHTFRPANPRDPIDAKYCAVCGLHLTHCVGAEVRDHDVPLPPEPPEDDQ